MLNLNTSTLDIVYLFGLKINTSIIQRLNLVFWFGWKGNNERDMLNFNNATLEIGFLFWGIVFDNSTPIIPQGVSTNIKPNPSLLHYTSAEGHAVSAQTYSDNIIVHDKFFDGNISRELEYKHT